MTRKKLDPSVTHWDDNMGHRDKGYLDDKKGVIPVLDPGNFVLKYTIFVETSTGISTLATFLNRYYKN